MDGIDEKFCRDEVWPGREQIQAELTCLLAQQFIDASALLAELAEEEGVSPNGDRTFYLSSMLEYLIIPLFEQKKVQVKIRAAEMKAEKRKRAARYQKLHLWIKLLASDSRMPENLNLQIEKLLADYSNSTV